LLPDSRAAATCYKFVSVATRPSPERIAGTPFLSRGHAA
jgi:hypothetical protein